MANPVPQKTNAANASATAAANGSGQAVTGSALVVMPDAGGSFKLSVPHSVVKHVQVVDVDMVLELQDGSKVVLAGGALGAMDDKSKVDFSDGAERTGGLFDQVGKIVLQKHDQSPTLNSDPGSAQSNNDGTADSHFTSNNNSAQVNPLATSLLAKIIQDNAGSLTSNGLQNLALPSIPVPPAPAVTTGADASIKMLSPTVSERSGAVLTDIVVGPQTPAMSLNLLNLTTITQVGSVLYGSGGSTASATDGSNQVQFAPQVITAGNDVHTIYATGSGAQSDFVKIFEVNITGDGTVSALTISGVPSNLTILNATYLGNGVYQVTPTTGQKTFDLQVQYTTTVADASQTVEPTATLSFDASVVTSDGAVTLSDTRIVVIKDASSYTDLSYLDPATGKSVWVLPAQGVPHEIHAGDGGVTIYGSNANDLLYGGAGADTIIGGSGDTYFEGGGGADVLTGGTAGVNTAGYKTSTSGVVVDLSTGLGSGGDAQGDVLSNIQNLIGSAYDDTFVANDKANRLDGGAGGSDTVSYAASTAGVTVNLITGLGSGGYAEGDTYVSIQNVIGSAYDDTFIASTQANHFDGGSGGSDTVSYANSTAAVTIDLSTGIGSGGSAAGDTYTHIENIIGSAYSDTFIANSDANSFDGGSGGSDTVSYANSATGVTVNFVSGRGTGGDAEGDTYSRIVNVIGSSSDDIFVAGIDSVIFNGGSGGSDTVNYGASSSGVVANMVTMKGSSYGLSDNNTYINIQNIVGSSTNDTFISGAAANHFDGGSGGTDTVSYVYSTSGVTVDLFNGIASGGYADGDTLQHIQNVIGSDYDDLFYASADSNLFNGGLGSNTVSYINSVGGVTIDLTNSIGTGTGSTYANGDSFINIQNLVGSIYDDVFIASADANTLDGGTSTSGSHNRVSYEDSTAAVIVDLNSTTGAGTSGGYAQGDKLINIQDLTGSSYDDTFVASAAANNFDGGAGSNTVSYASSNAGVTIDLVLGGGTGGYAAGDTFVNIQNIIGSAGDDTFIANNAANTFDGLAGTNTVSYAKASDSVGVTVDLVNGIGSNGFAAGDKYSNIQNVIGSTNDDIFIASSATNVFDGLQGSDTVSYVYSNAGVTVNLVTGLGSGGYAANDTYANIENVIGSTANDVFIASADANSFDGTDNTNISHNLVSYANSTAAVIVDLTQTDGTGTSGGYAQGDKLVNIQDLTGSQYDDTFVASDAINYLDGGSGTLHNRVSYVNSTSAVTVNLFTGNGTGGYADGDTYTNIQDVTGSQYDDTFVASLTANYFDGGTGTLHNRVSYANSTGAVTVNLFTGNGTGGFADGDTYTNIQDVTGSQYDDTFVASLTANYFDGGTGTLHNRVSYVNSTSAVTVNLFTGNGTGGFAAGDTYTNIQDVTGSQYDDTFVASLTANYFDGGTGTLHNRVSYANSTGAVTVNLFTGNGIGGFADGDTYTNIQDVTGSQYDDTFVASLTANYFDGGTGTLHNRVSYVNSTSAVTVNLFTGNGTGGFADGDTYTNIQDVTGSQYDDTFVASDAINYLDGGSGTLHNRVSYANSTAAVTVNLVTGTGTGGFADGDTYTNIQDVTGSQYDDTFVASLTANYFDGGTGTLHNRVSYANSTGAVTVNLFTGNGTGGFADGDTYTNIQDVTGSQYDDTFVASLAANYFDGGTGTLHNRVSYANSTSAVTVNLFTGNGTGGFADGDTYTNIQDVTGSQYDDTFVASLATNYFDGGVSTNSSHNLVSYANSTGAVTVNLFTGNGTGGYADGDTYTNIQDVTGSQYDDTFVASLAANYFDGGTGTLHNRVSYANSTGAVTVNLFTGNGTGGFAAGDTYTNIQDVTGSQYDDTFVASLATNYFDGGVSTNSSHNLVSYANSTGAVTVDLVNGIGTGGFADGDTYTNIQDVTGGQYDDTFIASAAANKFDGGTGSSHNLVSYANSTAAVFVNLLTGNGTGGYAAGDTYTNIQDITGSQYDDTFVGNAAANKFDGGAGSNTVSYDGSNVSVTVNLASGAAGSGGNAAGDTYLNIQNVIGGSAADNLTAAASGVTVLTGGAGGDTLTGIAANRANTYASYASSTAGVTVDLTSTTGSGTSGGDAAGDVLSYINNLIGSNYNDIFVANDQANILNGGNGTDTVSYAASTAAVTVDLSNTTGANTSGGYAQGDIFNSIENVIGSQYNDTLTGAAAGGSVLIGGAGADSLTGIGSGNVASYAGSALAVTVDLAYGTGTGGDAAGDTLHNIYNVIGSSHDDTFLAGSQSNSFVGGGGVDTVSYIYSTQSVIVDLSSTTGSGTSGGYAQGDTFANISNVIGSNYDDTFYASASANYFDGGSGSNTVSYARSSVGVVVDLYHNIGSDAVTGCVSYASGDTYTNIQNVVGTSGNDTFYASADANKFTGGGGNDTVSYLYSTANGSIYANLTSGTGTSGDANGDTYINILNLTGSQTVDSHLVGNALGNTLTAEGNSTINILDGGNVSGSSGTDILDARLGGSNTLIGGTANNTFIVSAHNADGIFNSATGSANLLSANGSAGVTTLQFTDLGNNLTVSNFASSVKGITTLDLSSSSNTNVVISAADVQAIGVNDVLTIKLHGNDSIQISSSTTEYYRVFTNGDYVFYDSSYTTEIARIHISAV